MERSLVVFNKTATRKIPLASSYIRIGREQDNDVVVNDRETSRSHALILYTLGVTVIADQNSLNGLYVNGKKVNLATLRHGDSIRIGSAEMRYHAPTVRRL